MTVAISASEDYKTFATEEQPLKHKINFLINLLFLSNFSQMFKIDCRIHNNFLSTDLITCTTSTTKNENCLIDVFEDHSIYL